jgi:hypothetical protein
VSTTRSTGWRAVVLHDRERRLSTWAWEFRAVAVGVAVSVGVGWVGGDPALRATRVKLTLADPCGRMTMIRRGVPLSMRSSGDPVR